MVLTVSSKWCIETVSTFTSEQPECWHSPVSRVYELPSLLLLIGVEKFYLCHFGCKDFWQTYCLGEWLTNSSNFGKCLCFLSLKLFLYLCLFGQSLDWQLCLTVLQFFQSMPIVPNAFLCSHSHWQWGDGRVHINSYLVT